MDFDEANRDRERRSRTQTIRLGLMLCSILILLDYANSPGVSGGGNPNSRQSTSGEIVTPTRPTGYLPTDDANVVNKLVFSPNSIGNLSSIYRGTWSGYALEPGSGAARGHRERVSGDVILQLRMLPLNGSPDMVFVYGVLKLTNLGRVGSIPIKDSYYPLQGLYLLRQHSMSAVLTPSRRIRLFLNIPEAKPEDTVKTADVVVAQHQQRLLEVSDQLRSDGGASRVQPDGSFFNTVFFHETNDWIGFFLNFLGRASVLLNRARININYVVEMNEGNSFILGQNEVQQIERFSSERRDALRLSRTLQVVRRQLVNMSAPLGTLFPDIALANKTKDSVSILSSVNVGSTGINLVSTRIDSSISSRKGSDGVGLGDSILPSSFKSMQLQLGASLDSACSASTNVQLDNFGDLVNGPKSSKGLLVKKMIGKVTSEECGFQLNTTLTEYHIDVENLGSKVGTYSNFFMVVCSFQIYLLVLQMKHSEPQGSSARISMLTVGSQALLDAVLCVGHLLLSVAIPAVFFYYFMWIAILKLVIYSVLEMRMMIGIYRARNLQNAALNNAMALRRYLSVIHTRFFIALFLAMMTINIFYDRPNLLIFVFYSFWMPQIVLNVYEGTRHPFLPQFSIGITFSRLFVPLYVFGCPKNFLAELLGGDLVSPQTCILLVSWLSIQLIILELQAKFGSRFFIPKRYLPVAYNYRRLINGGISERSPLHAQSGRSSSSSEEFSGVDIETGELKECVICYNSIDVEENNYMITPCDHLFHDECLSRWMEVKLECPVCRASLPPLLLD